MYVWALGLSLGFNISIMLAYMTGGLVSGPRFSRIEGANDILKEANKRQQDLLDRGEYTNHIIVETMRAVQSTAVQKGAAN